MGELNPGLSGYEANTLPVELLLHNHKKSRFDNHKLWIFVICMFLFICIFVCLLHDCGLKNIIIKKNRKEFYKRYKALLFQGVFSF